MIHAPPEARPCSTAQRSDPGTQGKPFDGFASLADVTLRIRFPRPPVVPAAAPGIVLIIGLAAAVPSDLVIGGDARQGAGICDAILRAWLSSSRGLDGFAEAAAAHGQMQARLRLQAVAIASERGR